MKRYLSLLPVLLTLGPACFFANQWRSQAQPRISKDESLAMGPEAILFIGHESDRLIISARFRVLDHPYDRPEYSIFCLPSMDERETMEISANQYPCNIRPRSFLKPCSNENASLSTESTGTILVHARDPDGQVIHRFCFRDPDNPGLRTIDVRAAPLIRSYNKASPLYPVGIPIAYLLDAVTFPAQVGCIGIYVFSHRSPGPDHYE
ncbi:MAG: hypothetical protein CMF59_17800 [Leptospiraceae bacterium]|nr:hypothetical protein [Leptospiraceae bacterium]